MSINEAVKRKEPEKEGEAPATTVAEAVASAAPTAVASGEKTAAAAGTDTTTSSAAAPAATATIEGASTPAAQGAESASEPAAKRLKPTPADPAAVRKQAEYYLSDMNLKYDKFFHEQISADPEGWLSLDLIVSCNKMKAMKVTPEDVVSSLKGSSIEVREDGSAIRRPSNAPLPKIEPKPQHGKKTSMHAHDGGVVAVVKDVPAEHNWQQVKDSIKAKLPPKTSVWHVSLVSDNRQCTVVFSPFEGDLQFVEQLEFEVGNAKLKAEVCHDEAFIQALKNLPKPIVEKREKEVRKRQKERNRPIIVGTQRFLNIAALKGRVRDILNSRSDGEQLKTDGTDFKLIKAILEYHPRGEEKSVGLTGLKVAKSPHGDSRCFYMVKSDGSEEDFSSVKCFQNLEQNPPYVAADTKKETGKVTGDNAPKANASEVTKEQTTVTEKPPEDSKLVQETKSAVDKEQAGADAQVPVTAEKTDSN